MVSLGWWDVAVKDIEGAHLLMMFGCMVFASVVGSVEDAFASEVLESSLIIPAFEPVETLVHGFGGSGSHGAHD
jgi:hypothetical protein